jgi:hypothetical protein
VSFYVKKAILNEAMRLGNAVHSATERWDKFGQESNLIQMQGWVKFLTDYQPKILSIEAPAFHPKYLYAGTMDRIAEIGGDKYILDIKSGVKMDWHPVQLAGYNHMLNLEYRRAGIYLDKKGGYRFVEYDRPEDHDAFIAALIIARWRGLWDGPKKRGRKKKNA